jgi:hypothetical protein
LSGNGLLLCSFLSQHLPPPPLAFHSLHTTRTQHPHDQACAHAPRARRTHAHSLTHSLTHSLHTHTHTPAHKHTHTSHQKQKSAYHETILQKKTKKQTISIYKKRLSLLTIESDCCPLDAHTHAHTHTHTRISVTNQCFYTYEVFAHP